MIKHMIELFKSGSRDILAALQGYQLAGILGWQDIRQRYRRSSLGPFWLTISMGVLIAALGFIFGTIFGAPLKQFLPFLAIGLIIWTLITTSLNEGCTGFIAAEGMIKQMPLPLFTYIMRVLWTNLIIFAHNLIILPFVLLIFWLVPQATALLAIAGLVLLMLNLSWLALIFGIICTRYRDVPQIISNLLQVSFYLTPIIWMPEMMPKRAGLLLLNANPFFHLIEVIRAPLLGGVPSVLNWQVCILLAIFGWIFTILFYGRFRSRIAYWL
jgi:lipopolysaccharide transport system permease protein